MPSAPTCQKIEMRGSGKLYTVKIPGEPEAQYLHWDLPLSEQPPEVLAKFKAAGIDDPKLRRRKPRSSG